MAEVVFEDPAGIAVGLLKGEPSRFMLALRWTEPKAYPHPDGPRLAVPWSGRATGWFVMPTSFAIAVGRTLVEMHTSGATPGFDEVGYRALVNWLVDNGAIADGLTY